METHTMALTFSRAEDGAYVTTDTQTGETRSYTDRTEWVRDSLVAILKHTAAIEEGLTRLLNDVERPAIQSEPQADEDIEILGWP